METGNIEDDYQLFRDICVDNDSDSEMEDFESIFGKSPPRPPREPPTENTNKFVDFEKYLQVQCENRITALNRSTFHQIKRPIIIGFNHFREKCYYHTKWLDRFYEISLKYGNRIEFIVADLTDMDLLYPHMNPISFFCTLVRPEDESISVYAIDVHKQIFQYFDAYKTVKDLCELCEKLLTGELYISQPIPEKSETFVKTCVHLNYDQVVRNSTKHILLIVGLGDYQPQQEHEPNYEQIAEELKLSNVDIIYIDGDKNYIPFELHAYGYPTIIFIPHKDKDNFVYFNKSARDTKHVMDFLQENISAQGALLRQQQLKEMQYKPFALPENTQLNFEDLNTYINEHFPKSLKVLDRNNFNTPRSYHCTIIYFMDFKGNGVAFYLESLQRMYQVAQHFGHSIHYTIADHNDLDVMYPKWFSKYEYMKDLMVDKSKPQVYAIDRLKRSYKINNEFETASSLFYFAFNLYYNHLFYSQLPRAINCNDSVKSCTAENLEMFIKKSKSAIFLTIYGGRYKESFKILKALEELVEDAKVLNVNVVKINAKLNHIPLAYIYPEYPIHFFIPSHNKDEATARFKSVQQNKEELLAFIRAQIIES